MCDQPLYLTEREGEVLQGLAEGQTYSELADKLFVSPRTVMHHANTLLQKLDCPGRSRKAIWRALELGIIRPPVQGGCRG